MVINMKNLVLIVNMAILSVFSSLSYSQELHPQSNLVINKEGNDWSCQYTYPFFADYQEKFPLIIDRTIYLIEGVETILHLDDERIINTRNDYIMTAISIPDCMIKFSILLPHPLKEYFSMFEYPEAFQLLLHGFYKWKDKIVIPINYFDALDNSEEKLCGYIYDKEGNLENNFKVNCFQFVNIGVEQSLDLILFADNFWMIRDEDETNDNAPPKIIMIDLNNKKPINQKDYVICSDYALDNKGNIYCVHLYADPETGERDPNYLEFRKMDLDTMEIKWKSVFPRERGGIHLFSPRKLNIQDGYLWYFDNSIERGYYALDAETGLPATPDINYDPNRFKITIDGIEYVIVRTFGTPATTSQVTVSIENLTTSVLDWELN